MQINSQTLLNKFILSISGPSESALNFKQGEILTGQVQVVNKNGLVSIYLKGQLIDAQSTVAVSKGQQLFLMVEDMKDGKITLKVLTPESLNKMENSNLATTLKAMNLPVDDKNLQMVKKLIQHNLPVTSENIRIISKGVNTLNGVTPRNLELVGMAMAKGAPITPQALESLAQFIEGKSNSASLTKETASLLGQMTSNTSVLSTSQTGGNSNVQATLSNNVFQLLKQINESMTLSVNQGSSTDLAKEIAQGLKTNLANENDFLRGLSLVKTVLQRKEILEVPKNSLSLLINNLDEIEKELAGQKLTNVMSRLSADKDLDFYYLSFPIKIEDEYRLSQLKIAKNGGNKSLADMDNLKFVVSLDTRNLGLVLFHVEWQQGASLKIEGVVESDLALKHIETDVNKLVKGLEEHNYLVHYNGIIVSTRGKEEMRVKLEEKNEIVKPFIIDVKV